MQADEHRLALEGQRLGMDVGEKMIKRKYGECAIMFMDASTIDEATRNHSWKDLDEIEIL